MQILDNGYVELIDSWGSDERIVEAARMSTQQGFKGWGTPENPGDEKLLRYLWTHKHATPFEMAGMTIEVKAPIFVFREWHRHRTQSYNETSARYAPLPDENYLPTVERIVDGAALAGKNKQAASVGRQATDTNAKQWLAELESLYRHAQMVYGMGLELGVPKEVARLPCPVARYSKMRASANLRNWLQFLTLRMDVAAQWEIRQYANAVGNLIAERFPRTWELFAERSLIKAGNLRRKEQQVDTPTQGTATIDDDFTNTKVILAEMIKAHQSSPDRSRERSLVVTKLQEARMWADEALAQS